VGACGVDAGATHTIDAWDAYDRNMRRMISMSLVVLLLSTAGLLVWRVMPGPVPQPGQTGSDPAAIPAELYRQGQVQTETLNSPDKRWTAEIVLASSADTGSQFQRLLVRDIASGQSFTPVARWVEPGLGRDYPAVVAWASDASSVFYTLSGTGDGCDLFGFAGPLYRANFASGEVAEVAPVSELSPDQRWSAGRAGNDLAVASLIGARPVLTVTASMPSSGDTSPQFGDIQWAPDSASFTYRYVEAPCADDLRSKPIIQTVKIVCDASSEVCRLVAAAG
jgi:hypothetical protein